VIAGIVLIIKRRQLLGSAMICTALFLAPIAQFHYWNKETQSLTKWLGEWSGSIGGREVRLEIEDVSSNLLNGHITAGPCHVGKKLSGMVDHQNVTFMTMDGQFVADLEGDSSVLSGQVSGCNDNISYAELRRLAAGSVALPETIETESDFQLSKPEGWGDAPLSGRMVWHVASKYGTSTPACSVVATADPSFEITSIDEYIRNQSEEKIVKLASMNMANVSVGNWEPNFELGGQRALHFIYSATVDGNRMSNLIIQTIRSGKLFTFSCNATADEFMHVYADLLKIADTFQFNIE
jgi:hypothetical protein